MRVTVDIRDVIALTREASKVLRAVPDDMKEALDKATAEERRTHVYNNYTFRLEGSTFALGPFSGDDTAEVEAGARMEYASFVEDRGRTRVRELVLRAGTELEYKFDGDADALGKM